MLTIDVFRLAAMGLWRRKLRAGLTIIGVIIGTICIIIMVSLGLTNMEQFNKDFLEGMNLTEIRVYSGQYAFVTGINQTTVDSFKQIPNVFTASGVLSFPVYVTYGDYEATLYVTAIDVSALGGIKIKEGGYFSSGVMPELLLGSEVLKQFFKPEDAYQYYSGESEAPAIDWLSKNFQLYLGDKPANQDSLPLLFEQTENIPGSKKYKGRVCGLIGASENSQYSYQSYMSLDIAKKLLNENRAFASDYAIDSNKYMEVIVIAKDIDSVAVIMDQVKTMGYEAYSQVEMIESIQAEQVRQQSQLTLIAAISLLVSAIGIANTMLTSILERRAQIGVMKVIGMKISKIRTVFLTEAALIGLIGGIVGAILSYIFSGIISSSKGESMILGMYFSEGTTLIMPFWLILSALGISVTVGVISGVYPAVRATKMSPLEAIRGGI
jgi:ABC-type antimicrobial peptide transport system permease subunit